MKPNILQVLRDDPLVADHRRLAEQQPAPIPH